ncbi:hypothetical protein CARUB_v10016424mg [Capsella rubella]|uniref:Uncharacterized protein n=1 Tax=Capsella rubella TaxID=81985 RepID=R0GBW2_9BRAS|nr:defensin-like protein 260 [Capsella rubella]EOA33086.1 hypothetical protein CARUB_v10016424mg [Capsella rubella]
MEAVSFKLLLLVSLLVAVIQNGVSIHNNESFLNQNSHTPKKPRCSGCHGGGGGGGRDERGPPPPCCKKDSDCKQPCPYGGGFCSNQCECLCKMVNVMDNNNVHFQQIPIAT